MGELLPDPAKIVGRGGGRTFVRIDEYRELHAMLQAIDNPNRDHTSFMIFDSLIKS